MGSRDVGSKEVGRGGKESGEGRLWNRDREPDEMVTRDGNAAMSVTRGGLVRRRSASLAGWTRPGGTPGNFTLKWFLERKLR